MTRLHPEPPEDWPVLYEDVRETGCSNCFDSLGATNLYDVELLSLYTVKGSTGWAVTWTEWCGDCVSAAARLGMRKIAGQQTYATDRQRGALEMRVRFSS